LDLAQVYYDVIVNSSDANTEDSFLENINLFIPGAKRIIANPKDGSIKIRLEDTPNELIPIHQFGDGANKLFRILILLTLHKGRRLMLDEIDSGIHYTKFKEFWKAILVLALKENTQIFATTHNEECIRYFNEVLTDLGDEYQIRSKIIQLEKINNHIRAYTLDFESLKLSVDEDLEIRGGEI
jgi:predicted ATPase